MDDYRESRHWPGKGGTVEPGDRAAVAKATFQAPDPSERPRFELRDATTDLMYHANKARSVSAESVMVVLPRCGGYGIRYSFLSGISRIFY